MRISDWSSDVCSSDLCAGMAGTTIGLRYGTAFVPTNPFAVIRVPEGEMLKLKRNLLSVALASATLMVAAAAQAQSQPADAASEPAPESQATEPDRVTVNGHRHGLENAIQTQQNSDPQDTVEGKKG